MSDSPSPADDPVMLSADLTVVLAELGGVLLSRETVDTAVALVTRLAKTAIPESSGAGVTLVDEQGRRSTAASDPLVEQADALQYQLDSGPCLTASRDRVLVRIDDVTRESRWPRWTAAVAPLGVLSVLSAPLVVADETIGAIKVYARRADAFDAEADQLLGLFAQQAAILLANTQTLADARQRAAQLREALHDRDVVGQAKGILLAQGAADDAAAFQMLAAAARRSRTDVSEVARRLAASVAARPPAPDPAGPGTPSAST